MTDSEYSHALAGFLIGAVVTVVLMVLIVAALDDRFESNHKGIKDRVAQEREVCEAQEDVVRCEWDENEATYIPKESK